MPFDPSRNMLAHETSPYLLQHKDNPVHWQAWDPAVFAHARDADTPILLSVGYAACHWCHVMAHESFENPAIAALMNSHFLNIKLDREERPDLDSLYMHALHLLGQPGGWPLTMFLTPVGEPFWGGTYFPPAAQYGRPGFPDILNRVAELYRRDADAIRSNADQLRDALSALAKPISQGADLSDLTLSRALSEALNLVDWRNGGLGGAPKFPQVSILKLLWRAHMRGHEEAGRAVTLSLERMCQGGLYDHLGGGFARYSVDAEWLVPHFEKMLYDNAELVEILALAWLETRNPLFATRITETVAWLLREMRTPEGLFAASLDADSEGEEGLFYLWTEPEISRLLGPDAALFSAVYDVRPNGNFEGRTILNRLQSRDRVIAPAEAEALAKARATLFAERVRRLPPGLDDKALADWNGLVIAALVQAGAALDEPSWIAAAETAFAAALRLFADPTQPGRLKHSYRSGEARHAAMLEDYASLARASLILYEQTFDPQYIDHAHRLLEVLDSAFADPAGGFHQSARDADIPIARLRPVIDSPTPSGNGLAAECLARLYLLTGAPDYAERCRRLLSAFRAEAERHGPNAATLIGAFDLVVNGLQIFVCGAPEDPRTRALIAACRAQSLPLATLQLAAPGGSLPASHPAHAKTRGPNPAAYLCSGRRCSLPIADAAALAERLRSAQAAALIEEV